MLPIADVGMAFSLAEDRGLSRSRFIRHSPGFNQHSPGFVCSVLRIAAAGIGRLRERAKRDESDSGDGSGNVSGPGLDPTGSGHSSRRVQGL